jgi:hypothetical protein
VLSQIKTEEFDPNEDIVRVERKGKTHDKLGSVFVKILLGKLVMTGKT